MRKRLRYMAGAVAVAGLAFWTLALLGPCCQALGDAQRGLEAADFLGQHHARHGAAATDSAPCPMVLAALESASDLGGAALFEPRRLPVAPGPRPVHIADVARMLFVTLSPSRSPPVPALPRYLSTSRLRI